MTTALASRAKVLVILLCVSTIILEYIERFSSQNQTYRVSPYKMHHHDSRQLLVDYLHPLMVEQFELVCFR